MNDIKINDSLLSWVLGCECEFVDIEDNYIELSADGNEMPENVVYYDLMGYLNLNTFIHLAKIKAFECGYDIVEYSNSVKILGKKKFYPKVNYNRFTIELVIEAIEWVAKKVGESEC